MEKSKDREKPELGVEDELSWNKLGGRRNRYTSFSNLITSDYKSDPEYD